MAQRPHAQRWVAGDGDDDYARRLRDTVATHDLDEAVAAGLPVVISGEVQLRSFNEENELGRIVDRTDPAALAVGLQAVLADDAGRRRVAGPAAVRETFWVERVGEQLDTM